MRGLFVLVALFAAQPAGALDIQWVEVSDPGNAADAAVNCLNVTADCGSVPYAYDISQYEITNEQYVAFLNAVATTTDTYGLYSSDMDVALLGGITQSGSPGSYTYAAKSGRENEPVVFVSWYDALRFANWLHNGQPTGVQGPATTEDGAYTFSGATTSSARNAGALSFLPTENEWYKAAYYAPSPPGYYAYPAGAEAATTCAAPGATPNTANCESAVSALTEVGSYTGSPSPYGTFDQGGNVYEWNEAATGANDSARGIRGGDWLGFADDTAAASRGGNQFPTSEYDWVGFRVARPAPEPGPGLLGMTAVLGLAASRRRRVN
ncbi:MAG: SUMF1/EgtB/PvdO family nonheme iron enzyme [Proteobacteria bacterium]|nr:SUMF1/EgtB/PvdO family nonheme iron enzyme [Pseudomonadota bacterium]